jgi:NAD(P)H-dependent FMN reductase
MPQTDATTTPPVRLLAISGSLRAVSSNTAALQALQAVAPAQVTIISYDRLAALPFFNPDLDSEGDAPPVEVQGLRGAVGRSDGVLIASPEYAHGVPGALKNALDWLVSSQEFHGTPVAILNISPRSIFVQSSLSETLATMAAALVIAPALTVPLPRRGMDVAAMLADPTVAAGLRSALDAVVRAVLARQVPDSGSEPDAARVV